MTWRELRDYLNEMPEGRLDEEAIILGCDDDGSDYLRAIHSIQSSDGAYECDDGFVLIEDGQFYVT